MIAIKVAEALIMRLVTCPPEQILIEKELSKEIVTIEAFNPQVMRNEFFEIANLHREKDGWGVDHLTGVILTEGGFVPATFLNNEFEANPLSLR